MPVLNLNEDERNAVIAALHHERVRLTGEWSKAFDDDEGSGFHRDSELERLAEAIDLTTDLRRKIEVAVDITKAAWHNEYGWLHPKKAMETAQADIEAGRITREEVANALGVDLDEVDAENATDRARQDQMSPGTWTTLPEDFEGAFEDTDFDAERGDSRARGFTALLFQDFSVASDADVKNALALVRERPAVITALKGNLDRIAEMSAVVS